MLHLSPDLCHTPPFVTVASWIGRCGTWKTLDLAVTCRVLLPHGRLTKL